MLENYIQSHRYNLYKQFLIDIFQIHCIHRHLCTNYPPTSPLHMRILKNYLGKNLTNNSNNG